MKPQTYNTKKNPIITKNFDCCTSHITKADASLLDRVAKGLLAQENPPIVYKYEEGYFIYVPEDHEGIVADANNAAALGFSPAFVNLLAVTRTQGCKYLQLDCDAMEYEDLPTFNW